MIVDALVEQIAAAFPHRFTSLQTEAVRAISAFLTTPRSDCAFILRGYAGTGKTSLVSALVRIMTAIQRPVVLLAPTGRAAKVFSGHSGRPAHTIHRVIYRQETFRGEDTRFGRGYNALERALFIVDEASMIAYGGGQSVFGTGCLLDDLVEYVYSGEGCRLLLVGDTAQLPPVGEDESPALSPDFMRRYGLEVGMCELTEVVRQSARSGVLAGATLLRRAIVEGDTVALPRICGSDRGEVRFVPGDALIETLISAYSDCGTDDTIVVTRSNKRASIYNRGIRAQIFDREEELTRGDIVMAVKNNYYWTERYARSLPEGEVSPLGFIANGDSARVQRLRNVHEQHGFRFADATLSFPDYDDFEIEVRVLLDTLTSDAPALSADDSHRLYESVLADYADIPLKRDRMKALRVDPYYNALQIKYAYAVTCHKAQGGQWSRVFVDQGYLPPDMERASYLRWLYTAFTRTTDRLYLVNWPEEQTLR